MAERGRPRLYQDHKVFAEKVDAYFAHLEDTGKRPTLAGISYYLGFEDRETFSSYASEGDDFARTIKRAKMRMEDDRWQSLIDKNTFTPGLIFDLKNNHGWKDKTEQELTGADGGPLMIVTGVPRASD
jgi:hypothetical protein